MTSLRRLACGAAFGALALGMSTAVYAQETTSAIRGFVTDASGAPVANASVTVALEGSGQRTTSATDAQGAFEVRGLRPGGPYTVTVAGGGVNETRSDVYLILGETQRLQISPAANEVAELVVEGAAASEASTASRTVLDETRIQSVVSITRDVRDLARRSPLVSQNARGDGGISIAGSNPRNNRVAIDGAQAQDDYGLNTGGLPTKRGPVVLDAIEQFTVDAVPIDVENGDFTGGALDIVLKSGSNKFHGSLFTNYLNDGMVGRSIRGQDVPSKISQTNYGGFLSGPIWKDRLFFAAAYELYESSDLTATGPTDAGFANSVRGVSSADLTNFVNLFNNSYATDFDIGTIDRTQPIKDEKYSFKIDANITDKHRLSLTARYALSELWSRTDLSTSTAAFGSHWYLTGEEDYSYVGELNSNWTDNLTTQLRVTYRDYERRQLPRSGQDFADISVCNVPTSRGTPTSCDNPGGTSPAQFRFGPDTFRHANELATDNLTVNFKAEYRLGDNLIKAGFQTQEQKIYNLFLPQQDGVYYFDSLQDFQNGVASRFQYTDAVGGRTTAQAAAQLKYRVNSVFLQDTLEITPDLSVTAGFRYDWYTNDDPPELNPNFLARNGYSNQTTYDGRQVVMPRVAVDWHATENLRLRGGFGLFSGGVPDVVAANSYGGGVGYLSSGIDIQRLASGLYSESTGTPGFTQAIGATALNVDRTNGRTFWDIPASVIAFQGGASAAPGAEVAAFSPGFRFPSDWKLFLSAQYDLPFSWSEGWRLGFDFVGSKVRDTLYVKDTRAVPLVINGQQQYLPDGRIRYDAVNASAAVRSALGVSSTNPGSSNRDLVFFNSDKGYSAVAALSLSKSFDFGLDVNASYTWQNIKDYGSSLRFASTQSSTYQSPAGIDPNLPAYGPSYEQIENGFKFEASYAHKFFGDSETRISLFAENRDGRPTSFVMGDVASGRSPVFGVNRGSNHLLYVPNMDAGGTGPNGLTYGNVVFADAATRDNFLTLVKQFGLPQGQIAEKGFYKNDDINIVDLQLSQELPTLIEGHKLRFTVDIQNLLNLLNDEWGIIEEYTDVSSVVSVACDDASAANPFACSRYRYSNFNANSLRENIDTNGRSLWTIQLGLRYQF